MSPYHPATLACRFLFVLSSIHAGLQFPASGILHFLFSLSKLFFSNILDTTHPSHLSGINLHVIPSEIFPKYHILISFPLPLFSMTANIVLLPAQQFLPYVIMFFIFLIIVYTSLPLDYKLQEAETLPNLLIFMSETLYLKGFPQLCVR